MLSSTGNELTDSRNADNLSVEMPGSSNQNSRKLYLRKAYHPLLVKKHHDNLQQARKDVTNATSVS